LRVLARNNGLTESKYLYAIYRRLNNLRFKSKYSQPIDFRGIAVTIGSDQSLFPSVYAGDFEHMEFDYLESRIQKGWCAWDVGANVGIWSLVLSKLVGENGSVHSFEPVNSTRTMLLENLSLNRVTNVVVNSFALSNSNSNGVINIGANAGCNTLVESESGNSIGQLTQEIVCKTGDSYQVDSQSIPSFIKIDVEGWEPEVVSGMETLLSKSPMIMVEVSGKDAGTERSNAQQSMIDNLFVHYGKAKSFRANEISTIFRLDISELSKRESFNLIFEQS
jgi:FkbM family methyltransferase